MFIQTQETPNPSTIKFLPDQDIISSDSTYDFSSASDAKLSLMASRLFDIEGVVRVFISKDFVSITKADDTDWSMLKPMVLALLMDHLSMGKIVIDDSILVKGGNAVEDNDVVAVQIKELLDERVRPMVAMDGGDIVFDRFENGVVYLHMQGACSGCPSATVTLKSGIESMLRHYIPEVKEVRQSIENLG